MATKIVLTVDEGLSAQEVDDLRYLLVDALGEFAARRMPVADYVENRYPGSDYYVDRSKKLEQVTRRCALARKLRNAALGHEVFRNDKLVQDVLMKCRQIIADSSLEPLKKTGLLDDIDQSLVVLL